MMAEGHRLGDLEIHQALVATLGSPRLDAIFAGLGLTGPFWTLPG